MSSVTSEPQGLMITFARGLSQTPEQVSEVRVHRYWVNIVCQMIRDTFADLGEPAQGQQLRKWFKGADIEDQIRFAERFRINFDGFADWMSPAYEHSRRSFRPPPSESEEAMPPTVVAVPSPGKLPDIE